MLSRDQILAAHEPLAGEITLDELGGSVGIRRLSAVELMEIREAASNDTGSIEALAALAAKLIGTDGNVRVFTDEDVSALMTRGYMTLEKIVREGMRLNGISAAAQEATKKN
jgi:hypothetical protein